MELHTYHERVILYLRYLYKVHLRIHPRYHKTVKRFKKYLVHDEKNETNVGDTVSAVECRPLSKNRGAPAASKRLA